MCESQLTGTDLLRYLLAGDPDATGGVLSILSKDLTPSVRVRVAENSATNLPTLLKLLNDSDAEVRLAVANNQNVPVLFLRTLAIDESVDVRYGLAENPHVPKQVLQELLRDENPYVSSRARITLERLHNAQERILAA